MIANLIAYLMHSRNQAHIFHLQTTSFAQHTALQKYYEGIVPLVDTLAETYQGRYGILQNINIPKSTNTSINYSSYFKTILNYIDTNYDKLPQDSELKNIYDEIKSLISSTIYLLDNLK